jgi:predicted GNAT family acetyltransferase
MGLPLMDRRVGRALRDIAQLSRYGRVPQERQTRITATETADKASARSVRQSPDRQAPGIQGSGADLTLAGAALHRHNPYLTWTSIVQRASAMAAVRDNRLQHRFELDVEEQIAFANYRETPQAVIITHTETPRALRGRGIASELVKGALELIRADGHKVIAGCGFVVDYLDKHPEYRDLVA